MRQRLLDQTCVLAGQGNTLALEVTFLAPWHMSTLCPETLTESNRQVTIRHSSNPSRGLSDSQDVAACRLPLCAVQLRNLLRRSSKFLEVGSLRKIHVGYFENTLGLPVILLNDNSTTSALFLVRSSRWCSLLTSYSFAVEM